MNSSTTIAGRNSVPNESDRFLNFKLVAYRCKPPLSEDAVVLKGLRYEISHNGESEKSMSKNRQYKFQYLYFNLLVLSGRFSQFTIKPNESFRTHTEPRDLDERFLEVSALLDGETIGKFDISLNEVLKRCDKHTAKYTRLPVNIFLTSL